VSRRARLCIFLPALAVLAALLVWGYTGIRPFGDYAGPYGFVIDKVSIPLRHMDNAVNATTYDIRGLDTMGEEFILFTAVIGVVLLLRDRGGEEEEKEESTEPAEEIGLDLTRVFGTAAIGIALLIGFWLVAFGFVTPGGGFQGGVALASGTVLLYIVTSRREWSAVGREHILDPLEGLGAGGFVVIGLAPVFASLPFLTNFFGPGTTGTVYSAGSAAFVNWAAALEVAAANLVLFSEYIQEYLVPIVRKRR
jgi:multicomponent Na+:H+ antiporter subunit B